MLKVVRVVTNFIFSLSISLILIVLLAKIDADVLILISVNLLLLAIRLVFEIDRKSKRYESVKSLREFGEKVAIYTIFGNKYLHSAAKMLVLAIDKVVKPSIEEISSLKAVFDLMNERRTFTYEDLVKCDQILAGCDLHSDQPAIAGGIL